MVLALSDLFASREASAPLTQAVMVSSVVAMAAYVYLTAVAPSSSKPLPCAESTLPLLGNTLDTMKTHNQRMYDWLTEQSSRHNGAPWALYIIGRPRTIVVSSPEILEDVLKRQVDTFPRGEPSGFLMRDFFGRGILAVDGDEWYLQRKVASHLFSLQMMKDVMADVIAEKVALLHRVLLEHAQKRADQPLSMRQTLTHFTSDVFAKIGFGVELTCLERSLAGDNENAFVAAFSHCAHVLRMRVQQPIWLWRLKRFLNVGIEKKMRASRKVINDLMLDIIARSVAAKNEGKTVVAKDLISLFLESKIEVLHADAPAQTQVQNPAELEMIRDMVINFIFAGKDTTSVSMSWFIVMMNRYPEVAVKIRQELREKMPSLCRVGELGVVPTLEDLRDLTYLEAAIRENLRLNPPVATGSRAAKASTVLSDGTVVNKGDAILMVPYALARQSSVWGEDAAEFKPERWIDGQTGNLITVSPFKFASFLAGPRMCIGRKFAMLEMKIALAVMMSRFELTTVEDPWSMTYEMQVTAPVKGPLMVKVAPLDEATNW